MIDDGLTGEGAGAQVLTVLDGNQLSGAFNVSFPSSSNASAEVSFDATANEMKAALETLGTGGVYVQRSGPDLEGGFVWTISFLEQQGDLPLISTDGAVLFGDDAAIEVKIISTHKPVLHLSCLSIHPDFFLSFLLFLSTTASSSSWLSPALVAAAAPPWFIDWNVRGTISTFDTNRKQRKHAWCSGV